MAPNLASHLLENMAKVLGENGSRQNGKLIGQNGTKLYG